MIRQVKIYIGGEVQGVFFRHHILKIAQELELKGFVKNLDDGRVYIEVQGEKQKLDELINFAKVGPPLSQVKSLKVKWQLPKNSFYKEFKIEY